MTQHNLFPRLPEDIAIFLQGLVADTESDWFTEGDNSSWRDGILSNGTTAAKFLKKYGHRITTP